MDAPRVLVAGVGNIFLGDDAFGVEVVRRLTSCPLPQGVIVKDFGIRGLDLAYALLDGGYAATIVVDAAPRGGEPGTLYTIEPDVDEDAFTSHQIAVVQPHGMDPLNVFRLVKSMGGNLKGVLVVGCEPLTLGPAGGAMGLSAPVEAAVDEAVTLVESLLTKILSGEAEPVRRLRRAAD
jgi:hydrogenase maturation protease